MENKKGFIQIPILILIIAVVSVITAGVVLYEKGALSSLLANVGNVSERTKIDIEDTPELSLEEKDSLLKMLYKEDNVKESLKEENIKTEEQIKNILKEKADEVRKLQVDITPEENLPNLGEKLREPYYLENLEKAAREQLELKESQEVDLLDATPLVISDVRSLGVWPANISKNAYVPVIFLELKDKSVIISWITNKNTVDNAVEYAADHLFLVQPTIVNDALSISFRILL